MAREKVCSISEEQQGELSVRLEKRLAKKQKRVSEINRLIRKLYEDNISGKLNDKRFNAMLSDYELELEALEADIDRDKRTIPLKANQVLLDLSFIQPGQVHALCGKRRFTLAHECAHQILFGMESDNDKRTHESKYAPRAAYSLRDLKTREDWNEWQANVL